MKALQLLLMAFGTLATAGALGFLMFLSDSVGAYAREPEDAWLQGGWALLLGALAALSLWAAWRLRAKLRG